MSAQNGEPILKVGKQGKVVFEFGEGADAVRVRIDVIATHNAWAELDRSFRNDKGEIEPHLRAQSDAANWNFLKNLIMESAGAAPAEQVRAAKVADEMSMTDMLRFYKLLTEEGMRLRDFFEIKSEAAPSSPERSDVTFST